MNLIIIAHPDDEALWFSSILLRSDCEVILVTCGDTKKRHEERKKDFEKSMKLFGVNKYTILSHKDKLGRLSLEKLRADLKKFSNKKYDGIYTHGIYGETYNHPHHQDVSYIVHEIFNKQGVYSISWNLFPDKVNLLKKEEYKTIIEEHIQRLGLPLEVLDSFPHQLSGGMRQRVVIALATFLKPKIIIADEPTTALDVIVQRGILQLLLQIQKEMHSTIIVVTHDMGVHAQITQRLIIMYAGKIVELGPTREVFKNPLHPYTEILINSLPIIGDKRRRPSIIKGRPPSLINPPSGCRFHPRCPYARDICRRKEPVLIEASPNHYVSCFKLIGEV